MEPKDIKTLFEYFDGQFLEVSQRFDRLKTKVDGLTKRFDVFSKGWL